MALRFLEEGFTRNAAEKAFQACRALTEALLALERDRVIEETRDEEQRKGFLRKLCHLYPRQGSNL